MREFEAAGAAATPPLHITPAPCGQAYPAGAGWHAWMPSGEGLQRVGAVLHEVLAGLADRR